jgi:hypothetical protein
MGNLAARHPVIVWCSAIAIVLGLVSAVSALVSGAMGSRDLWRDGHRDLYSQVQRLDKDQESLRRDIGELRGLINRDHELLIKLSAMMEFVTRRQGGDPARITGNGSP